VLSVRHLSAIETAPTRRSSLGWADRLGPPTSPSIAVDATGVGRPVVDMIDEARLDATVSAIT